MTNLLYEGFIGCTGVSQICFLFLILLYFHTFICGTYLLKIIQSLVYTVIWGWVPLSENWLGKLFLIASSLALSKCVICFTLIKLLLIKNGWLYNRDGNVHIVSCSFRVHVSYCVVSCVVVNKLADCYYFINSFI